MPRPESDRSPWIVPPLSRRERRHLFVDGLVTRLLDEQFGHQMCQMHHQQNEHVAQLGRLTRPGLTRRGGPKDRPGLSLPGVGSRLIAAPPLERHYRATPVRHACRPRRKAWPNRRPSPFAMPRPRMGADLLMRSFFSAYFRAAGGRS
jgi:hypothetical protein